MERLTASTLFQRVCRGRIGENKRAACYRDPCCDIKNTLWWWERRREEERRRATTVASTVGVLPLRSQTFGARSRPPPHHCPQKKRRERGVSPFVWLWCLRYACRAHNGTLGLPSKCIKLQLVSFLSPPSPSSSCPTHSPTTTNLKKYGPPTTPTLTHTTTTTLPQHTHHKPWASV